MDESTAPSAPPLPLAGVRVLDLTRYLPGPFCTQLLGDFGADVIKVEDPHLGDPVRMAPPFAEGPANAQGEPARVSAAFLLLNRNKRSVSIDLKHEGGREAFLALVRTADVLVEGFRPGVMERLGLGYEALARVRPELVYVAISGYGQTGPRAKAAGHDLNYMGFTGALALNAAEGGAPRPLSLQAADLSGALYGAIGALLALEARRKDPEGRGQLVDVSMLDTALSLLPLQAAQAFYGAAPTAEADPLGGALPNYAVYETQDGGHLAVGALEPHFWARACDVLGLPELAGEAQAALFDGVGPSATAARARVAERVRERTLAAWVEAFADVDACVSPVLTPNDALDDEQVRARGLRRAMPHPLLGLVHQIAPAIALSRTPGALERAAPALGEHTDEVLGGPGGLDAAALAALRQAGAVGPARA